MKDLQLTMNETLIEIMQHQRQQVKEYKILACICLGASLLQTLLITAQILTLK